MPNRPSSSPTSHPRAVREVPTPGQTSLYHQPDWRRSLPWLVQGITSRATGDLGLFTASPSAEVQERWSALGSATECEAVAHARQVHGVTVRLHDGLPPGLLVAPAADGHVTGAPGLLLTVTVADCVPVYLVHPASRALALLHAGWRGVAGGILARGVEALAQRLGTRAAGLRLHLGPAICGVCYEVGPEVHQALSLPVPSGPAPVDLRGVLARQAVALGIEDGHVTVSEHCTRCGGGVFYSHRGGHRERQVAYLGRTA